MHCYPIYLLVHLWEAGKCLKHSFTLLIFTCTVLPQKNTNFNDDKKVFAVEYPSLHCEYGLLSLINKAVDWPIARQDRVRQDKQTEDTGMKRGSVREWPADTERPR